MYFNRGEFSLHKSLFCSLKEKDVFIFVGCVFVSTCMYMHYVHVWCWQMLDSDTGSPETRTTERWEPPCGC